MREVVRGYHPGLEFYRSESMGLAGAENDEHGNQRTYQYLSDREAASWLAAWLAGESWVRAPALLRSAEGLSEEAKP